MEISRSLGILTWHIFFWFLSVYLMIKGNNSPVTLSGYGLVFINKEIVAELMLLLVDWYMILSNSDL